jgi:hypothetical protein
MATTSMAEPEIVSCQFDDSFQPHLLVMDLDWGQLSLGREQQLWELPGGLHVRGPAPIRFGIDVVRRGADSYSVRLLWNQNCLGWNGLRRPQLLDSSLTELLATLGTDLHYLLDQPITQPDVTKPRLRVG